MGSKISIRNDTNLTLNIRLCQVGTLYKKNAVKFGEEMVENVGKVWFTIRVQWHNGETSWYGVYMGSDRRFEIRGGPIPTHLEINGVPQVVFESRTLSNPFTLFDLDSNTVIPI